MKIRFTFNEKVSAGQNVRHLLANSLEVLILNHFLRTWKFTITASFTSRQLATSYEILVASTEFLVALATRKAQFRTLIKLWVVAYETLKTKEKSSWVIPKVVAVAYDSFSVITKFKSHWQFKLGFTKVVVIRADCLQEWWQGEL